MVNRLVSVGDDFTLPAAVKAADANLPARLQDGALNATFAPASGSQKYSPRIHPLELMPLTIYGHSYTKDGAGADNGTRFFDRLASRQRMLAPVNYGLSGRTMGQIQAQIASTWTPNSRGLVGFGDGVINDIAFSDSTATPTCKEAFRSSLAYLTAKAVSAAGSSAWQFGPGWSNGTSSTAGSYADAAFTGDSAYLILNFVVSGGGTITVANAGTTIATISTAGYKYAFNGAVKVSGLGAGNHTLRVTLSSGTATLVGVVVPSTSPPPVAWFQAGPYSAASDAINTLLANTQAACASILTDFPSVVPIPAGAGWDNTTMLGPDGLHPNDKGHDYIANVIEAALLSTPFAQGLNQLTGATSSATYTAPAPAYAATGATVPAQVTGFSATASSQITLAWSLPTDGGATLTGYVIQYSLAGANTWTTYTPPSAIVPTATSHIIASGLTAGTAYDFRIAATNSVGTGTYSATASATTGTPVTTYAADTFTRADSASMGSTETGAYAWTTADGGVGTILSNQLKQTAATTGSVLYFDDTHADGTISVNLASSGGSSQGLLFRRNAADGTYYVVYKNGASYVLARRGATVGTYTTIGTYSGVAAGANDLVKVVLNGSTITTYVNGTQVGTTTQTINQTSTGHGVWAGANAGGQLYDNFTHTSATV